MRLVLLLMVAAACDKSDAADRAPAAVDGETVYMRACAACHQADGRGTEGAFPPLAKVDYLARTAKETQIDAVLNGMRGPLTVDGTLYNAPMPPNADLSDAQIAAVLTYIRTSWGNTLEPVRDDEVARFRKH